MGKDVVQAPSDADLSVEADIAAIDLYLVDVTGRKIVPSTEVSDLLLDVRSRLMKYRVDIPEELPATPSGLQKIG